MWLTSTVKIDDSQSIPGAEWPGMRYRKQFLQDSPARLSPAPSRCSRTFSRCAFPTISEPGTGRTWFYKTSYVIGSTILVTNLETLVWFSPSPMLIWVLQSSQCSKIRVAQHWERSGAHLRENEGVRSECKKDEWLLFQRFVTSIVGFRLVRVNRPSRYRNHFPYDKVKVS